MLNVCKVSMKGKNPAGICFFQSQQWKHQNNVWNLLKFNNTDTKIISFWYHYCYLRINSSHCSGFSFDNFEQRNAGWKNDLIWCKVYFGYVFACWLIFLVNIHFFWIYLSDRFFCVKKTLLEIEQWSNNDRENLYF